MTKAKGEVIISLNNSAIIFSAAFHSKNQMQRAAWQA